VTPSAASRCSISSINVERLGRVKNADGLSPRQRREAAFDFCQHDQQISQRIALQGRGGDSPLVIMEVMGRVDAEVWMVWGIVPAEQCAAAAKQLVSVAGVARVVVEPDLKTQRWSNRGSDLDPESVLPVDFQVGDPGIVRNRGRLQEP
jgi:hypothetical protein